MCEICTIPAEHLRYSVQLTYGILANLLLLLWSYNPSDEKGSDNYCDILGIKGLIGPYHLYYTSNELIQYTNTLYNQIIQSQCAI